MPCRDHKKVGKCRPFCVPCRALSGAPPLMYPAAFSPFRIFSLRSKIPGPAGRLVPPSLLRSSICSGALPRKYPAAPCSRILRLQNTRTAGRVETRLRRSAPLHLRNLPIHSLRAGKPANTCPCSGKQALRAGKLAKSCPRHSANANND